MKKKCDHCERPATHHSVEVQDGQKIEKHLCDLHAAQEGLSIAGQIGNVPLPELLTNFVKQHAGGESDLGPDEPFASGGASGGSGGAGRKPPRSGLVCEHCQMTFAQFREQSLLGCPHCYKAFESELSPLLERAHEGGSHHVGKVPRRAGADEGRQAQLSRMRQRLEDAIAGEDFELAARIRDDIQALEEAV